MATKRGTAFTMTEETFRGLKELLNLQGSFFLAVTGGIASGKTTVAGMLKDLGAQLMDFDILAREVVEPGKPAWEDIVASFGKDVLREDHRIDRQKLSGMVFRDPKKRLTLETLTHPRIFEAYLEQVKILLAKDPGALILGVMPLLYELGLEGLFHRVLVVYIPREKQMERLMVRDGISREKAESILHAQLSIEEKRGKADFVIHNEHSLEETEKAIRRVWEELRRIQRKPIQEERP